MAGLVFAGAQLKMVAQTIGDRVEVLRALDITAAGTGRTGLADEVGNDFVLAVACAVERGTLGEGHDPIAQELDAVDTVDLFGRKPECLLSEPLPDADDPPEDRPESTHDADPRSDPHPTGWFRSWAQLALSLR